MGHRSLAFFIFARQGRTDEPTYPFIEVLGHELKMGHFPHKSFDITDALFTFFGTPSTQLVLQQKLY